MELDSTPDLSLTDLQMDNLALAFRAVGTTMKLPQLQAIANKMGNKAVDSTTGKTYFQALSERIGKRKGASRKMSLPQPKPVR